MNKFQCRYLIQRFWVLIHVMMWSFCAPAVVSGNPLQESFYEVLPDFERKMSQAATSWKQGNLSRAIDFFHNARKLISEHMPTPMDGYGWRWSRSLNTYALVLARLVEIESGTDRVGGSTMQQMKDQLCEWADQLQNQALAWKFIGVSNESEGLTRTRWLNRYAQAIRQARRVCTLVE